MKQALSQRAGTIGILTMLCVGLAVEAITPIAMAQQESRRRRRDAAADAKPIELTPDQVTQLTKVANERKLNVDDLIAASKTYMPSGRHDDYVLFSSGGQSGQVFAIGVPACACCARSRCSRPSPGRATDLAGSTTRSLSS